MHFTNGSACMNTACVSVTYLNFSHSTDNLARIVRIPIFIVVSYPNTELGLNVIRTTVLHAATAVYIKLLT
jgi:hypothetical protein